MIEIDNLMLEKYKGLLSVIDMLDDNEDTYLDLCPRHSEEAEMLNPGKYPVVVVLRDELYALQGRACKMSLLLEKHGINLNDEF